MQRITLRKTGPRTRGCFGLIIVNSVWEFCLIDFDFPGFSLNTIPNPETNEITVSLSGVYEISADLVVVTNELETSLFNSRLTEVS
ncbi:hypothetical protein [Peribacillus frigoritolerans]|uniref:hypothetical protein n=1 Tax=Peribacillus frigoritolerans TaxID=450367 RepID=UPI0020BF1E7B|nr:hypothetical protein [Peribacillus frigoritolerans]